MERGPAREGGVLSLRAEPVSSAQKPCWMATPWQDCGPQLSTGHSWDTDVTRRASGSCMARLREASTSETLGSERTVGAGPSPSPLLSLLRGPAPSGSCWLTGPVDGWHLQGPGRAPRGLQLGDPCLSPGLTVHSAPRPRYPLQSFSSSPERAPSGTHSLRFRYCRCPPAPTSPPTRGSSSQLPAPSLRCGLGASSTPHLWTPRGQPGHTRPCAFLYRDFLLCLWAFQPRLLIVPDRKWLLLLTITRTSPSSFLSTAFTPSPGGSPPCPPHRANCNSTLRV